MQLEPIQVFIEVVDSGSFAAAARARRVAPSSISRAIAELEADLGARLFHRTTRCSELTEAGRVFHEQVAPAMRALGSARTQVRDLAGQPMGRLRVGVASSFARLHLSSWLPDFLERNPEVQLELVTAHDYSDRRGHRPVCARLLRAELRGERVLLGLRSAVRHGLHRPWLQLSKRVSLRGRAGRDGRGFDVRLRR